MTRIDRASFRRRLEGKDPIIVPYTPDALTARLCTRLGFEAGYLGGGGLGYSLAVSEALLTLTELASAVAAVRRRSTLPLIVDGGVGFGDAVHLTRTVAELETAGAHAIEIEDQVAPKRVSHHRHIEHLVPAEEMVKKVRFAVQAREDPDLLIIARTGAIQNEGFDDAINRCRAYRDAGADAVMLLPEGSEQRALIPEKLDCPVATLTSLDLHTPDEWADMGYALVIDPVTGQTAAWAAITEVYQRHAQGRSSGRNPADAFRIWEEFQEIAGLEELYEIERDTTEPGT
ncbi:isocitrate lyase/PEP mutase family protein [Rhodococcus sp. T2V]|uniref:isocitrate lyase/PEP mutase family protein n=1 Tax=Rhodococcus sp. T2V TaxID=3034164 RepID=UPI0023E34B87|nr:isocitrate lyase/PEP mutase family protein [Rhodococcus sp. T2V]MDF3307963.1 isocitrate lyase/PEP mutase family protein [Rhodococcus sp. T2V]